MARQTVVPVETSTPLTEPSRPTAASTQTARTAAASERGAPARAARFGVPAIGGGLGAFGLFLFLAWLQPVLKGSERLALEPLYAFDIKVESPAPPPPRREEKPKEVVQKRVRQEPKPQEKSLTRQAPTRAVARPLSMIATPRADLGSSLGGGVDLFGGPGAGGGADLEIAMGDSQVYSVLAQAEALEQYDRQRQLVREMSERGELLLARGSGSGVSASPPVLVRKPKPLYPASARQGQLEGFVMLRLLVSEMGDVKDHKIVAADPEGVFEQAIVNVLPRFKYRPARDDQGRPLEFWVEFTYLFELKDA